jgi:hypothetical protein
VVRARGVVPVLVVEAGQDALCPFGVLRVPAHRGREDWQGVMSAVAMGTGVPDVVTKNVVHGLGIHCLAI